MNNSEAWSVATYLAREIFKIGDERDSPCRRIQFIGGEYPDHEKAQGGLCEDALVRVIQSRLVAFYERTP